VPEVPPHERKVAPCGEPLPPRLQRGSKAIRCRGSMIKNGPYRPLWVSYRSLMQERRNVHYGPLTAVKVSDFDADVSFVVILCEHAPSAARVLPPESRATESCAR
jgi:hypothetical protein